MRRAAHRKTTQRGNTPAVIPHLKMQDYLIRGRESDIRARQVKVQMGLPD